MVRRPRARVPAGRPRWGLVRAGVGVAGLGVLALLTLAPTARGQVTLRDGGALDDVVHDVSRRGVECEPRLSPGTRRTIAWDLVREVAGDQADKAAAFRELAEKAWRARSRLARGDSELAEPLLNELYEGFGAAAAGAPPGAASDAWAPDPTRLHVCDGLMRCRLLRADQAGAVAPWLDALELLGSDSGSPGAVIPAASSVTAGSGPVIDAETGLCPWLPPVWVSSEATAALAKRTVTARRLPPAAELERLYLRAACLDAGLPAPGDAKPIEVSPDSNDPGAKGVALVRLMVKARENDPDQRRAAREKLLSGLSADADTWREAWRRAAVGRSLLMESDAAQRAEGVVHLLHIQARFARSQPYLAGVALVQAAAELRKRGGDDAKGGARLLNELKALEPFHPALGGVTATGAGVAP